MRSVISTFPTISKLTMRLSDQHIPRNINISYEMSDQYIPYNINISHEISDQHMTVNNKSCNKSGNKMGKDSVRIFCFVTATSISSSLLLIRDASQEKGPGGSMSQVVGLPNNSYKPITNTAWVLARLCKLQKGCTRLASASDKVYQLLAHGRWFSPASSTTKTGRHDIAEILLKVAINTTNQSINQTYHECGITQSHSAHL